MSTGGRGGLDHNKTPVIFAAYFSGPKKFAMDFKVPKSSLRIFLERESLRRKFVKSVAGVSGVT